MPITFSKIDHLQPAQNNAAAALESLGEGLAAIEQAADGAPGHPGWRRDVAISYGKPSATLRPLGETETASDALRHAQAIIEPMASLFSGQRQWKARSRLECHPDDQDPPPRRRHSSVAPGRRRYRAQFLARHINILRHEMLERLSTDPTPLLVKR
jgi:hypothetical protein